MSTEYKLKDKGGKKNITIEVNDVLCKGCTVCVDVCPTDTLLMVPDSTRWQGAVAMIRDINRCTGCMLCEIQCPDFAIEVTVPKKPKKADVAS